MGDFHKSNTFGAMDLSPDIRYTEPLLCWSLEPFALLRYPTKRQTLTEWQRKPGVLLHHMLGGTHKLFASVLVLRRISMMVLLYATVKCRTSDSCITKKTLKSTIYNCVHIVTMSNVVEEVRVFTRELFFLNSIL